MAGAPGQTGQGGQADRGKGILDLAIGPVAHRGHCVARIAPDTPGFEADAGRVVFVRHALPGERVHAVLTDRGKIWRADAIEVLGDPSPDRIASIWPAAAAGGVGGGELAHVSPDGQRRWKAAVVTEQLRRLAGIDWPVEVEAAAIEPARAVASAEADGAASGSSEAAATKGAPAPEAGEITDGYRTRISLHADGAGRAGMRRHRSHEVVPLDEMPLASAELAEFAKTAGIWQRTWPPGARLDLIAPSGGEPVLLVDGVAPNKGGPAPKRVREVVRLSDGREFRYDVAAQGFWQVHRDAPRILVQAVLDAVGDLAGQTVLDLYAGAGLFTLPLAAAGARRVVAVEGSRGAVADARHNLRGQPNAEVHAADVAKFLARNSVRPSPITPDIVVLDPPRSGAGRVVVERIAALRPRRVVYVACDPAALARDVAWLASHDYQLRSLRAIDLFPATHHVECVAVLEPRS